MRLFRGRLAPCLAGRIGLHSASYRKAYDERGRNWITLDGRELFSFCDFVHENAWRETGFSGPPPQDLYSRQDFAGALEQWFDLPVEEALASGHPLILMLAMLDGRLGKRRLKLLAEKDRLPEMIRTLLDIRLEAEGMRRSPDRAPSESIG